MSGKYGGWIRTSCRAVTVFAWSSEKHAVLGFPDGKLCVFSWLILGAFIQCSAIWLGAVLVGINHLVFQKELIREDSLPLPPYTQHRLRPWWLGGEEPTCQAGDADSIPGPGRSPGVRRGPYSRTLCKPLGHAGSVTEPSLGSAMWLVLTSKQTFYRDLKNACKSKLASSLELVTAIRTQPSWPARC